MAVVSVARLSIPISVSVWMLPLAAYKLVAKEEITKCWRVSGNMNCLRERNYKNSKPQKLETIFDWIDLVVWMLSDKVV